jgi:hypothetical protein
VVDAWAMNAVTRGMMSVKREKDGIRSLSYLSFPNKSQIQLGGGRSWLNPFESCGLKLVLRVDLKKKQNDDKFDNEKNRKRNRWKIDWEMRKNLKIEL